MNKIAPDLNERVPEGWRVVPLRWYLSCKSGESIDTQLIEKEPSEDKYTPVIGGNGIMGYSNKVNITNETLSIGRVGALCGNVHYINYPCWITDNSLLISRYNRSEMNLEFFKLILEQLNLNQYSNSTAQPLITGETIKKRKIALPSIEIQKRIVTYVNNKVKELDVVINYKIKINELLEEKRQAIITEAVTKGLNPKVKMKDSGVEWIGEIPENWGTIKAKYLFNEKSLKDHADKRLLSVSKGKGVIPRDEMEFKVVMAFKDLQNFKLVEKNDFVIHLRSFQSGFEMSEVKGIVSPAYTIFSLINEGCTRYFKYVFYSKVFIDAIASTTQSLRDGKPISYSDFGNMLLMVPDSNEQIDIANTIENNLNSIDKLINSNKTAIKKLYEYRQSLTYEAVTGKIDVRDFEVVQ